ncbi:MAG: protein translocase subunit SecD, partial [Verrucomicrobiae bacterium]|nr:protein translocase subunit SecD [Verrucomicrobiae bacterium]
AVRRDAVYSNIVYELRQLQARNPARAYGNLLEAIGTNDITGYFPFWPEAKTQPDPTRYILNRLQREGAGKIKLGLDLQGGVSFLVQMQYETNPEHLLDTLVQEAKNKDAAFTNMLEAVQRVVKNQPDIQIAQVLDILATNDLARYFDAVPQGTATNRARAIVEWVHRRALETSQREAALGQAVEVLRKRVDRFGVAEPIIQPAGSDRILIQLPGLSEAEKESAMRQIQRAAFLEFRLVHPDSDELVMRGERAPGYEFLPHPHETVIGGQRVTVPGYLVQKKPAYGMTGKYIKNAFPTRDPYGGGIQIAFNLTSEGAKIFGKLTEENVGRQLAIVLDGVLYSAPVIRTAILGGSGVIEGDFDIAEAQELANVLQNPLEAPVKIIEAREVDPSLGKDTIQSGIRAAIIGAAAVAAFMLFYYLLAGLVANVALLLNVLIILGVMCAIEATFTLPGIAGIVLTIGMAVDANVLIFERIREELTAGKSLRGAIAAGYSKAFGTILDTNLTTLIASVILIIFGTGPVKGFGTALTIGITASMFTALVVTRLIFDLLLDKNVLKSLPMLKLIGATNIDFLRWAVPAFIASWALILVGNAYGVFIRGHKVLGPDFAGGIQQTYLFTTPPGGSAETLREDVRKALAPLGLEDVAPVVQRSLATGAETLRLVLPYKEGISELVSNTLREKLPQYNFSHPSVDTVGPVVGKEITRSAIIATLLAMFG